MGKMAKYSLGATAGLYGPTGFFGGVGLFVFATLSLELFVLPPLQGKYPGDYGDPLGFDMYTPEMRTSELNYGRAAMVGVITAFIIEVFTGLDAVEQLSFPFVSLLQ